MSKLKNRLMLIDSMTGNSYYNSSIYMKDYFNINNIDSLLEKISSNDNRLIKNKSTCYFLCKQKEELVDFLKNDILNDEQIYLKYVDSRELKKSISFENLEEINIFKRIMNTKFYRYADEFIYAFREGTPIDNILYQVSFFEKYNIDISDCGFSLVVYREEIKAFLKNSFIWDFEDEDILNFILNRNEIGMSFDELTKEHLDILKYHNSIYLGELNKENLDVIDKIVSVISSGPDDKDKDNMFYGFGSLSEKVKTSIYSLRNSITDYIDTVTSKYEDNETQKQLVCSMLEAIKYKIIDNEDEMNLLINKIKYDFEPKTSLDIGLDFAGISSEFFESLYVGVNQIPKIINLKKNTPKGFFRKISASTELTRYSIDIDSNLLSVVSNVLELGQLNESQVRELIILLRSNPSVMYSFSGSLLDLGHKVSYDEFMLMYNNRGFVSASTLDGLKGLKQSVRLLKLKSIIEINKVLKNKDFCINYDMVEAYIADKDVMPMIKKDNPLEIKDIGDYIEYKVIDSIIPIDSISILSKIKLLLQNDFTLDRLKGLSLDEIDNEVWNTNSLKNLVSRMNLSESFVEEYKDNIINFLGSEEYNLVNSYYCNPYSGSKQRMAIMLIAKAVIAGKYEDLKFVREDIKKEISMDISDEAFESWKRTDIVAKDCYTVQDSSDFNYIMRMGDIPVRTCMNYVNGMYSHCLLSNFDTSKKMILIHKNGKYVGRAIVRLTVMSDTDLETSALEFVDVDNSYKESKKESSNELIIFLEKTYTGLDYKDFSECYDMMVELLKEKAKEMGAKLVVSRNYADVVKDNCIESSKYVFITASKNGAQYLDSFDGSTSSSYCYKNGRVYIY